MSARVILGTWGRPVSSPAADAIYIDLCASTIQRGNVRVGLSQRVMHVATALLCAGRRVTTDELIAAIYRERNDGGPLDARGAIVQFIHRFRRSLAKLGIGLESGYGAVGYGVVIASDWREPPALPAPLPVHRRQWFAPAEGAHAAL